MAARRILPAVVRYTEDGNDATRTVRIACNARDRRAILRNRARFARELRDAGHVMPPGCDCRHCRNDWDCCGRMVPGSVRIFPARRGVVAVQYFARNI